MSNGMLVVRHILRAATRMRWSPTTCMVALPEKVPASPMAAAVVTLAPVSACR